VKRLVAFSLALLALLAPRAARAQHDMSKMEMTGPQLPLGISWARLGGGTSWIPDASPMFMATKSAGAWQLMLHGAAFGQYDHQPTIHGDTQIGVIDWEMLMAARPTLGGVLRLTAMTSAQPLIIGRQGYPELLQTGGSDNNIRYVNRQHPHELIGELSAAYDRSLTSNLATGIYAAAIGEPAIGPPSYMHRPSAFDDPFAPLGHHWQDATHETHGVVTAGVYSRRVRAEGSIFNARESNGDYLNIEYDGARLDSYSGRLTLAPNANVTMSAWAGYLFAHDPVDGPIGMQRYGVSLETATQRANGGWSSTGVVWGINVHHHGARVHNHTTGDSAATYNLSSALLVESSFALTSRATVYGRIEEADKSADDLGFLGGDLTELFTVRALSLGGAYDVVRVGSAAFALGARGTLNLLPESLRLVYSTTRPMGVAVYLRVRPRQR
jgi:hypothetical protein